MHGSCKISGWKMTGPNSPITVWIGLRKLSPQSITSQTNGKEWIAQGMLALNCEHSLNHKTAKQISKIVGKPTQEAAETGQRKALQNQGFKKCFSAADCRPFVGDPLDLALQCRRKPLAGYLTASEIVRLLGTWLEHPPSSKLSIWHWLARCCMVFKSHCVVWF